MAKNRHRGSGLDDFLAEEGVLGEFQAKAIKEVVACSLLRRCESIGCAKAASPEKMHTSRTQVDRVLDPKEGNVSLETLQLAAAIVGRRVELTLVDSKS